jgi:hypothetical protein
MARRESKIGFAAILAVEEEGAPAVMPEIAQRHLGNTKSKSQTEQRLELKILSAKTRQSAVTSSSEDMKGQASKKKGRSASMSGSALRRANTKRGMSFSLVTLEQNLMMPSDDEDEDDKFQSTGDDVEDLLKFLRDKVNKANTASSARRWSMVEIQEEDNGKNNTTRDERDLAVLSRNKELLKEHVRGRPFADIKRNIGHLAATIRKEEAARAQNQKRRQSMQKAGRVTTMDRAERMAALEFDTLHGFARLQSRQSNWIKKLALVYRAACMGEQLKAVREARTQNNGAASYIQMTWRGHFKKRMDSAVDDFHSEISPQMQWRWSLYIRCFQRRTAASMARSFFTNFGRPTMAIAVESFRSDIIQMQNWIRSWIVVHFGRINAMTRRIAAEEERVYKRLIKEAEGQMAKLQDAENDQDRRKQAESSETAQAKIREERESQEEQVRDGAHARVLYARSVLMQCAHAVCSCSVLMQCAHAVCSCTTRALLTHYSRTTHALLTHYSRTTHALLTHYSRTTHALLMHYSRTTHAGGKSAGEGFAQTRGDATTGHSQTAPGGAKSGVSSERGSDGRYGHAETDVGSAGWDGGRSIEYSASTLSLALLRSLTRSPALSHSPSCALSHVLIRHWSTIPHTVTNSSTLSLSHGLARS